MDISQISTSSWIAIYGALLSTAITIVAFIRYFIGKIRKRKELLKFQTDLYLLRKVDRTTKKVYPIVVVLLANLGTERISFKSLEYEGISENGLKVNGSMGWYEQPEEVFGVRNRLLPIVLESGQTADLPMIEIGIFNRNQDLKIWLKDFNYIKHYLDENDIQKVKHDIEKFIQERNK